MAVPRLLNKNNSGEFWVFKWGSFLPRAVMLGQARPGHTTAAIKRIMQEARELANDPSTEYTAAPLEVCATPWPSLCAYSPSILLPRALLGQYFCVYFSIMAVYSHCSYAMKCGL
jgi:hypothetical protein